MEKMAQPLLNSLSKQNLKVQWKIPRRMREMSSAVGVVVPGVTSVVERETSVEVQDQESPRNEDKKSISMKKSTDGKGTLHIKIEFNPTFNF